jgi:hypothetical protein
MYHAVLNITIAKEAAYQAGQMLLPPVDQTFRKHCL